MEGVLVIKNVSVKPFGFSNGVCTGDQERVCQPLQLPQWRVYWWSRTSLTKSSASLTVGIFVTKTVSVKLFSFFNGGCIGDQESVCKTLRFPQWSVYRWSRTCLSKSSASFMDGIFVIKNVSIKLFSFINGWYIRDQHRVCQALQLLQWRVYSWSRTCLSNSSASLMEGIFVIKDVSVKLYSSPNGECIGDQERVCQTLQLLPWRVYWCSRTCLWKSSASLMDGIFVIKYVSAKLFSFFNGGSIGDQVRVCQTLQFLQWRVYWWSRTCLSNSPASSMEGVLVIKTCLSNSSAPSMESVLVIKNVSVKLLSFINGGYIRDQDRVCQALQLLQWRVYSWSRTCLSNSPTSLMEGLLMIKNVSVKLFDFSNGGCIGDKERVCQTFQFLQWREYLWSRTCLSNSSASLMEGVLVIKDVSVKSFSFFNGGYIRDQDRVCQTIQLLQWRVYWWSRTCL